VIKYALLYKQQHIIVFTKPHSLIGCIYALKQTWMLSQSYVCGQNGHTF